MKNHHNAEMHCSIALGILLMAGLSCAEINCTESVMQRCRRQDVTFFFPGTEDELRTVCTSMLGYLDCVKDYTESCEEHRGELDRVTQIRSILQDICAEDTAFHRAIADNLPCIRRLFMGPEFCDPPFESDEINTYAETVKERGITHLGKTEERSSVCMRYLHAFGCATATIGKECSNTARNATLLVFQRVLAPVSECRNEVVEDFPAVVALFEASESKMPQED